MPPTASIQSIPSPLASFAFNQTQILEVVFFLVFFVWAIYTIVIIYHWMRYGNRAPVGVPIILAHFVISLGLFIFGAVGFL
jgi:hypothetical protein